MAELYPVFKNWLMRQNDANIIMKGRGVGIIGGSGADKGGFIIEKYSHDYYIFFILNAFITCIRVFAFILAYNHTLLANFMYLYYIYLRYS